MGRRHKTDKRPAKGLSFDREAVLGLLKKEARHPLLMKEIVRELGVPKEERQTLKRIVKDLRADGEIVKIRGNRYGVPDKMSLVVGTISVHPDGYGFVSSEKEGEEDVYVGYKDMKGAMHRDKVVVRVETRRGGARSMGTVIRILERGFGQVVGKYDEIRRNGVLIPNNPRINYDFHIPKKDSGGAKPGDIVLADIVSYPELHAGPEGRVVRVLGTPMTPGIETDIVIAERGLATKFSRAAVAEAKNTPAKVTPSMVKDRHDLRGLPIVTIDGEDARDFDDAVYVERDAKSGGYRLWVSIADVANYVTPGSGLDGDAYERATSVYFPDRVLPMLPEELSNGICSLNPGVDRLTLTAEMLIGKDGVTKQVDVYESVIKSAARMTYTRVAAILDGDEELSKEYGSLSGSFFLMRELMTVLHRMRDRRGSLDLDIPEAVVKLNDDGTTRDIVKAPRNDAHRLIEEFMLAANEAVASHLERHGVPFLYRIHEEPDEDRLAELAMHVKGFGLKWPTSANIRPIHVAKVIKDVKGRPEERFINTLILRSMKLARYSPDNAGHFGLASNCYCHFTSPIRRYPDLTVHRALKELIRSGEIKADRKSRMGGPLPALGLHTSAMEREAEEAEREVVELKKLQFMVDKVGLDFEGYVSGVTAFGFFVELEEHFVEGLVRMTSLYDDYYEYEEDGHRLYGRHTGRTFRVGDTVRVVLERVDLERRQMDFSLEDTGGGDRPRTGGARTEPSWAKYRRKGRGGRRG